MNTSPGFSRSGIAPIHNPCGISAGMSFMLCTAISIRRVSSACSISLTNRPLPPTRASGTSRILSPWVFITISSTGVDEDFLSRADLTQFACHRASLLPRVPILMGLFILANGRSRRSWRLHIRCRRMPRRSRTRFRRRCLWKQTRMQTLIWILFCFYRKGSPVSRCQIPGIQNPDRSFYNDIRRSALIYSRCLEAVPKPLIDNHYR